MICSMGMFMMSDDMMFGELDFERELDEAKERISDLEKENKMLRMKLKIYKWCQEYEA